MHTEIHLPQGLDKHLYTKLFNKNLLYLFIIILLRACIISIRVPNYLEYKLSLKSYNFQLSQSQGVRMHDRSILTVNRLVIATNIQLSAGTEYKNSSLGDPNLNPFPYW